MVNYEDYESDFEPRERRFRFQKKGREFDYSFRGQNLRYLERTCARDIVLNGRLFRVWDPESRGNEELVGGLRAVSYYPDISPFVCVMPDFHISESSVNGSVIPSRNLLYVNAVGGDIGCGMASLRLPISLFEVENKLDEIYRLIYSFVPTGRQSNQTGVEVNNQDELFNQDLEVLNRSNVKDAKRQFGTLGGGNHFVELQTDEDNRVNVMVHTGSRVIGQIIKQIFTRQGITSQRPKGLIYLEADSRAGQDYLAHVKFALDYAKANRKEILSRTIKGILEVFPALGERINGSLLEGMIDVPHNYVSLERHFGEDLYVHRKGAVHLEEGELGLIPGSMGTHSYVVMGRGNQYGLDSCSHGAGRSMPRGKALDCIRKSDYLLAMRGIVCRTDDNILDEAPQAYKDVDKVINHQKDLVRVCEKLKPVVSVKG